MIRFSCAIALVFLFYTSHIVDAQQVKQSPLESFPLTAPTEEELAKYGKAVRVKEYVSLRAPKIIGAWTFSFKESELGDGILAVGGFSSARLPGDRYSIAVMKASGKTY